MQHVGQRLLAGVSQHETDVRTRRGQQFGDRVGNRPIVAAVVQPAQQCQRLDDGGKLRVLRDTERVKRLVAMAVQEQRFVVDCEQRAPKRREHRHVVVGPFDRRECRAHRLDFFAVVERLPAHEKVRHAARLERFDVSPASRLRRNGRSAGTGCRCAAAESERGWAARRASSAR